MSIGVFAIPIFKEIKAMLSDFKVVYHLMIYSGTRP